MNKNNYKMKISLTSCALLVALSSIASVSAMDLNADLEENLRLGGTCEEGSIDLILSNPGDAEFTTGCPSFAVIVSAMDTAEEETSNAAEALLIDQVIILDAAFDGKEADFIDESDDLTFTTQDPVAYGMFGCEVQDVIRETEVVGTRSDPRCVENRVNEAGAVQMNFKITGSTSGDITDSDSEAAEGAPGDDTDNDLDDGTRADDPADDPDDGTVGNDPVDDPDATDPEVEVNSEESEAVDSSNATDSGGVDSSATDFVDGPDATGISDEGIDLSVLDGESGTVSSGDTGNLSDEGGDLGGGSSNENDLSSEGVDLGGESNNGSDLSNEGIDLGGVTINENDLSNEGIAFDVHTTPGFTDLQCYNQTKFIDMIPAVAADADTVTNSRRIQEQVFLINRKMLEYTNVNQTAYKNTCEAHGGDYRIVNVTTLCRRRSIKDARIRQRVNYVGRNFPVCAGLQCEGVSDDDFDLVFAESLTGENSTEFWDQADEDEYWTCSGAFAASLQTVVGVLAAAAAWYLL